MTLAPQAGGQTRILIEADLGAWKSLHTCRKFSSRLQKEHPVEPANMIFALSHTHSAPLLIDAEESLPGSSLHREWMKALQGTDFFQMLVASRMIRSVRLLSL
jgi:hypothetical protein